MDYYVTIHILYLQERKYVTMETSKDQKMSTMPIPQLMISLAIPSVIAQIINVLYNIVDRIYIGHMADVGDIALTGVGVTFPIIMLLLMRLFPLL